jgi:hypothetical protein
MSILDSILEFSDAQVISCASASASTGTNEVDLTVAAASHKDTWGTAITADIGEGNNGLVVNFQVATVLEASAIVVAKAYHHTASGVTSGSTFGDVSFAAADAVGTRKNIRVPAGTINKWIGVEYSVVGSSMNTGAFDAWLGLDTETPTA